MLRRLRDECDLILSGLSDEKGPTKKARDDFVNSYKMFQGFHNGKSILYAIKTLKKKKESK
jgi:hypothetical protein